MIHTKQFASSFTRIVAASAMIIDIPLDDLCSAADNALLLDLSAKEKQMIEDAKLMMTAALPLWKAARKKMGNPNEGLGNNRGQEIQRNSNPMRGRQWR